MFKLLGGVYAGSSGGLVPVTAVALYNEAEVGNADVGFNYCVAHFVGKVARYVLRKIFGKRFQHDIAPVYLHGHKLVYVG